MYPRTEEAAKNMEQLQTKKTTRTEACWNSPSDYSFAISTLHEAMSVRFQFWAQNMDYRSEI
jgi:hypothetical protein